MYNDLGHLFELQVSKIYYTNQPDVLY